MSLSRAIAALLLFATPTVFPVQVERQDPAIPLSATPLIAAIMQRRSSDGDFSGTVLVAREGKIVYENALGYANREWNIPNALGTKFEIGSMTKQFTALLILQFVNEGKLSLDGHISDHLPDYRKDTGKKVTIRELLSHTSGIPDFFPPLASWMVQRPSVAAAAPGGLGPTQKRHPYLYGWSSVRGMLAAVALSAA